MPFMQGVSCSPFHVRSRSAQTSNRCCCRCWAALPRLPGLSRSPPPYLVACKPAHTSIPCCCRCFIALLSRHRLTFSLSCQCQVRSDLDSLLLPLLELLYSAQARSPNQASPLQPALLSHVSRCS